VPTPERAAARVSATLRVQHFRGGAQATWLTAPAAAAVPPRRPRARSPPRSEVARGRDRSWSLAGTPPQNRRIRRNPPLRLFPQVEALPWPQWPEYAKCRRIAAEFPAPPNARQPRPGPSRSLLGHLTANHLRMTGGRTAHFANILRHSAYCEPPARHTGPEQGNDTTTCILRILRRHLAPQPR
jgi:hypothetical protein